MKNPVQNLISSSLIAALSAIGVFVFTSTTAMSQIVLTRTAAAPTTDILIQSADSGSGTGGNGWMWKTDTPASDQRELVQQFTFGTDYQISSISFFTGGGYPIDAAAQVPYSIEINSYSSASSSTPSANIATYTGNLTRSGSGNLWYNFDIPNTDLSAGTLYGFVLKFKGFLANNSITVQSFNGSSSYTGGGYFQIDHDTGSPVSTNLNADMRFLVQGVVVPEPSVISLAFAALGSLAAIKCFRLRV